VVLVDLLLLMFRLFLTLILQQRDYKQQEHLGELVLVELQTELVDMVVMEYSQEALAQELVKMVKTELTLLVVVVVEVTKILLAMVEMEQLLY
tara:strand:+ start:19 stop:297 length:279 start_codon:yes stop_codon:yes gene_type:complete